MVSLGEWGIYFDLSFFGRLGVFGFFVMRVNWSTKQ